MNYLTFLLSLLLVCRATAQEVFISEIYEEFTGPSVVVIAEQFADNSVEVIYSATLPPIEFQHGPTFSCYPTDGFVASIFPASLATAIFWSFNTPCGVSPFIVPAAAPELTDALRRYRFRHNGITYHLVPLPSQFLDRFPFTEIRRFRLVPC